LTRQLGPRTARAAALTAAVAAAAAMAGCGGVAARPPAVRPPPPTLPARAVPYLPSSVKPLTEAGLAREVSIPGLAARLERWGFDGGARRYFQGQSRRLQVVDARTLRFGTAAGARSFVAFARAHPGSFLGGAITARPFAAAGRRGFVARAASCACHLATPAFLGVVARDRLVTWLEINGPRASVHALAALTARAP
jgi:hypothetical protein